MPDADELIQIDRGAIVAPAGYGKTELIAKVAALGQRTLVLTHTNAGVQAIRSRLKRLRVPQSAVVVDTISGWSLRFAHGFPGAANPPDEMPTGPQWDEVHRGVCAALGISAVRQVVEASYDRILIDEYQDCNAAQHALACALSHIAPTLVFGDPMQGIFEFAGATLSWGGEIHRHFPLIGELETPHRWKHSNPALGEWIMDARSRLIRGERVEFETPVVYREAKTAFEMEALFESIDDKAGNVAAIHCNKGICYGLAAAARGGYQAIEEMAGRTLLSFSRQWDASAKPADRLRALRGLFGDSFAVLKKADGEAPSIEEVSIAEAMAAAEASMAEDSGRGAIELLKLARKHPRWRLHRGELIRDVERAFSDVAAGRAETMVEAAGRVRDRATVTGRKMPRRTVSTPLLLKGLEFDHVVLPDARHFGAERSAQAKLFYVAVSRATVSLTITGPVNFVRLPAPQL